MTSPWRCELWCKLVKDDIPTRASLHSHGARPGIDVDDLRETLGAEHDVVAERVPLDTVAVSTDGEVPPLLVSKGDEAEEVVFVRRRCHGARAFVIEHAPVLGVSRDNQRSGGQAITERHAPRTRRHTVEGASHRYILELHSLHGLRSSTQRHGIRRRRRLAIACVESIELRVG
jgi:hypothetical protein